MGDGSSFSTEGMQAFDMPEIRADYADVNKASAQAAVLSMAAQMVCDRLKPVNGGVFRASESAPLYEVHRAETSPNPAEDPYANPYPPWVLSLAP